MELVGVKFCVGPFPLIRSFQVIPSPATMNALKRCMQNAAVSADATYNMDGFDSSTMLIEGGNLRAFLHAMDPNSVD